MAMLRKLVLSDRRRLRAKYGAAGIARIMAALEVLIAADRTRNIATSVAWLDAARVRGRRVRSHRAREAWCKHAVDALYRAHRAPDYLLLLGGPDVVPHQTLHNPIVNVEDVDADLPSDLPYACEAPHSRDVSHFVGPTRVVGRLPDVPGARDALPLARLIEQAATHVGAPGGRAFAVSAAHWRSATEASLALAFAQVPRCRVSPPDGPAWPASALHAPMHFINLHGADTDPNFYGQPADGAHEFPVAMTPASLATGIAPGAVIAAECCFGAQLYRPRANVPVGMAATYLGAGAGAFLGSTNIAYGAFGVRGRDRRCNADILCAAYFAAIRARASTGRALLAARQAYVRALGARALDVFDLKTLGQFVLLGDPSQRPFGGRDRRRTAKIAAHRRRRRVLKAAGLRLQRDTRCATRGAACPVTPLSQVMRGMLLRKGLRVGSTIRFSVPGVRRSARRRDERVHVMFATPALRTAGVRELTAVIARSVDGRLTAIHTVKAR